MSPILADQQRPSYMSPKCGGRGCCGVSANENSCAHHVTRSPIKLWRSNSIFNLWGNSQHIFSGPRGGGCKHAVSSLQRRLSPRSFISSMVYLRKTNTDRIPVSNIDSSWGHNLRCKHVIYRRAVQRGAERRCKKNRNCRICYTDRKLCGGCR